MLRSVFVAYATRGGSTGEVAEAIAASMRKSGLKVELTEVGREVVVPREVAVILGAPLYMGGFPREFHRFLSRNQIALEILKPWCFVLGPTRANPADFEAARQQAIKQLARYRWFCPADVHVFGGRWDPKTIHFPFSIARWVPGRPLDKIPASDIRDWGEIERWAVGISRQLTQAA